MKYIKYNWTTVNMAEDAWCAIEENRWAMIYDGTDRDTIEDMCITESYDVTKDRMHTRLVIGLVQHCSRLATREVATGNEENDGWPYPEYDDLPF